MKQLIKMILISWFCTGCNMQGSSSNPVTGFKVLNTGKFKLEIAKMDNTDTVALFLKIRLYPGKVWSEKEGNKDQLSLLYGMDSCFFLSVKGKDIRPSLFQPINNGVKGSYEYLISFEPATKLTENILLKYKDKFISGNQYLINLNQ